MGLPLTECPAAASGRPAGAVWAGKKRAEDLRGLFGLERSARKTCGACLGWKEASGKTAGAVWVEKKRPEKGRDCLN